jgi:hypothetical protein
MLQLGKPTLAVIAVLAMTADGSVMAQDAHDHDTPPQSSEAAAPASCPMDGPGMGPQAMHGVGTVR